MGAPAELRILIQMTLKNSKYIKVVIAQEGLIEEAEVMEDLRQENEFPAVLFSVVIEGTQKLEIRSRNNSEKNWFKLSWYDWNSEKQE